MPLRLARELQQKSEPKSPAPLFLMGPVLLAQQKYPEAIDTFNSALKLKGDLVDAHRGLGQAYQQLSCWQEHSEAWPLA